MSCEICTVLYPENTQPATTTRQIEALWGNSGSTKAHLCEICAKFYDEGVQHE